MKNLKVLIPFALLFCIGVAVAYFMIKEQRKLPIYSPIMLNPELVDSSKQLQKSNHKIAAFELIDQYGESFSNADVDGKIYVADFFFTTCPSICIDMSAQLERVQDKYKAENRFLILSHTVQPEIDSVAVLKAYADLHQAKKDKWIFLTGSKKEIYDLARKSYFAATTEGDGGPNDFIHTENFVLVDTKKRIRGFYDGTSEEDVNRLIEDIEILIEEEFITN